MLGHSRLGGTHSFQSPGRQCVEGVETLLLAIRRCLGMAWSWLTKPYSSPVHKSGMCWPRLAQSPEACMAHDSARRAGGSRGETGFRIHSQYWLTVHSSSCEVRMEFKMSLCSMKEMHLRPLSCFSVCFPWIEY